MTAILLSLLLAAVSLPDYHGPVNDFAGVLTPDTQRRLETIFYNLRSATGAELAVVTVGTTAPLDSKSYAVELFKKWGVGRKGRDNGVLLLLAVKDHRVEIEVGYGLEGILPDARCGRILDEHAVPYFRRGDWSAGLVATAQTLADAMRGGAAQEPPPSRNRRPAGRHNDVASGLTALFLVLVMVGIFALVQWRLGRCPKCGYRPLTCCDNIVTSSTRHTNGRRRREISCPKCGYHEVQYLLDPSPDSYGSGGSFGGGGFSFGGGCSGGGGAGRGF
jgi:uncharacterized protein